MHLYSLRSHSYGVKKAPDMNLKMFRRTLFFLNCVSIPESLNLFNLLLWLMLRTNHPPFTVGRRYMYLTGRLAFGTALSQTMPHLTALQSFNPVQSNSHVHTQSRGRTQQRHLSQTHCYPRVPSSTSPSPSLPHYHHQQSTSSSQHKHSSY